MEEMLEKIAEIVKDCDYQKMYALAEEMSEKGEALMGMPFTSREFLERLGYGLLEENQYEQAYVFFRAGAECCSSAVSQFNLGSMYANGQGVKRNLGAAYYWLCKASQNGIEKADELCDVLLRHMAQEGNPLSNLLYGGKDTALPGLRRAMNVGMFLDGLIGMCETGNDMLPKDLQMSSYLKEQRGNLMEKYK